MQSIDYPLNNSWRNETNCPRPKAEWRPSLSSARKRWQLFQQHQDTRCSHRTFSCPSNPGCCLWTFLLVSQNTWCVHRSCRSQDAGRVHGSWMYCWNLFVQNPGEVVGWGFQESWVYHGEESSGPTLSSCFDQSSFARWVFAWFSKFVLVLLSQFVCNNLRTYWQKFYVSLTQKYVATTF